LTLFIGFLGAVLGAVTGGIGTYVTTRSSLGLTLEHSYDQALQEKRLERYQALFHVSECLPRYWPPMEEEPTRDDLQQYMRKFHNWYFGEKAGGMFLTPSAKDIYIRLLNSLAETAYQDESASDSPLSANESKTLRELASELRRQLAEDVGAANPPRLRWARPGPQAPPPSIGG
jgi:hypothetical protein